MSIRTRRLALPPLALTLLALLATGAALAQETAPAPAEAAADPRAALLAELDRTRALFLAAIDGVSAAQWNWKPAPDRWSVGECAEHITRTEAALRGLIAGTLATPTDPALLGKSHGKSASVLATVIDRSSKATAPEPLNPMQAGEVRSRDAIEKDFSFERGRSHELATGADLLGFAAMNPVVGELDVLGWFHFLSGHVERHVLQIEEVKSTAGWPSP